MGLRFPHELRRNEGWGSRDDTLLFALSNLCSGSALHILHWPFFSLQGHILVLGLNPRYPRQKLKIGEDT